MLRRSRLPSGCAKRKRGFSVAGYRVVLTFSQWRIYEKRGKDEAAPVDGERRIVILC